MDKYNHKEIDKKWQDSWEKEGVYKTGEGESKPKYYVLDMFPYPSGDGLHVGHPKGYIATDILARMKMMQGFNVLHPMGFDAFGLPAENYALKNKVHPRVAVEENIKVFKEQLKKIGFTHDWSREVNTTDPDYYKWTQWTFIQMFKKGLAFESNEPIIWCPSCQTGLAQEDLENGKCERCDSEIERKPMRQWVLKITDYADRLLNDLDKLDGWDDSIKEMQKNWIGRSEGVEVKFQIQNSKFQIPVFTTRPDTLFGCTYVVLAPEHVLIKNEELRIKNYEEVLKYVKKASSKSDLERTDLNKDKSGVKLDGVMAVNPVNGEEIPVFVADYVLVGYGTGAIMAVPAHDKRDWDFAIAEAQKIKYVVEPKNYKDLKGNIYPDEIYTIYEGKTYKESENLYFKEAFNKIKAGKNYCFTGKGITVNSNFLNGSETDEAKKKMIEWLEDRKLGTRKINYKLNDWVFSRQRYWGEPIPMVHCEKCGTVPVDEKDLPVKLPEVEKYAPTGTGESPLVDIEDWVNTTCPKCSGKAKRETNTMPQWAGSSWYYLRYIDTKNDKALVDKKKEKYWSPVDFYVGGAEHATRHLIYARFWHKFLYDIGVVNYEEPFTKLQHVGLIMDEDGRKMSKRWGNVINPNDIIEKHGADAMRIYEMFMGPFGQAVCWSTNGLVGARRFLDKVWDMDTRFKKETEKEIKSTLHKTIKKVGEDIIEFKFNTAVSQMMILVNKILEKKEISKEDFEKFLIILSPFAPHLTEEIWREKLGHSESIFKASWPKYDPKLIKDEVIKLVIQINGKVRDTLDVPADISEDEAKKISQESEKIKKWLEGKEIVKIIFVKGKLINIVIK